MKKKFKLLLNNFFLNNNFYRVVPIINLIKKNGWVKKKSWEPHGSVLYFYRNKYMILTGRHRLVALKYCYLKGYVKNIQLNFPILEGKFKIRNLNY